MINDLKKYKAPALEKGLDIIELLIKTNSPLSMSEIANKLNRSKSEIFRMLAILEERGYLKKPNGSESFIITNKVFDIGMKIAPVSSLLEVVMPEMRSLAEEMRQSCHLAVLNKYYSIVIARIESPASIGFSVRPGHSVLANKSGSGCVLLSNLEKVHFQRLIKKIQKEDPDLDKNELLNKINLINENGYLISPSCTVEIITDISAPIRKGIDGEIIASITVPFVENKNTPITQEEIASLLIDRAKKISELALTTLGI